MTLLEKINGDMINYMKSKDNFSLGVIRMVKGALQLEKINKKRDLTDEEVISVIAKQIKMRNDSINEFKKANRMDLVEQNEKEIAILNEYMPVQLTEDEINEIIDLAFEKINPTSNKDFGLIMKEVSPKVKGKADMGMISAKIKDRFASN